MRRFFVEKIPEDSKEFAFDAQESKHIRKVLRLREGDEVSVFDGTGREVKCLIRGADDSLVYARVVGETEPSSPESRLSLTLAPAIIKGHRFDLVIQKAVELGVEILVPIVSKRSDVKPKKVDKKLERWRKIIIESSKQCGRARLMKIAAPAGFEEFCNSAVGTKLLFSERDGGSFAEVTAQNQITALTGPEGGWDTSELEFARARGFQIITLGGRVLRAETAAISVSALLQNRFGDLV